MAPCLLLPWKLLFFDTLRPREKDGSEGVAALWSVFVTALVSFRTLAFLFPLVTRTFSSFNATHSLSILDHCFSFISPMPGVKVSESKFLIFFPLHHLSSL